MLLGKYIHTQKDNTGPLPKPYIKMNSKSIKNSKVRGKAILLEENIGENLHDFWLVKEFSYRTQNESSTKEKTDKLNFIKM